MICRMEFAAQKRRHMGITPHKNPVQKTARTDCGQTLNRQTLAFRAHPAYMPNKLRSHVKLGNRPDGYTVMTRTRRDRLAAFADFRLGNTQPQPQQPEHAPEPDAEPEIAQVPSENAASQSTQTPDNPTPEPQPPKAQAEADKDVENDRPQDIADHAEPEHAEHDTPPGQPTQNQLTTRQLRTKYRRWFLSENDRNLVLTKLLVAANVTSERELPAFFKVSCPMPAMIGIDEAFRQRYRLDGDDSAREQALNDALRYYCRRMAYISAIIHERDRYDLDLNPVEPLIEEDRASARMTYDAFVEKLKERKRKARQTSGRDKTASEDSGTADDRQDT